MSCVFFTLEFVILLAFASSPSSFLSHDLGYVKKLEENIYSMKLCLPFVCRGRQSQLNCNRIQYNGKDCIEPQLGTG